jgi:hypothetical protein
VVTRSARSRSRLESPESQSLQSPESDRDDLRRSGEQGADNRRGSLVGGRDHVCVSVQSHPGRRVADASGDGSHVHPGCEQFRDVCVPEVVKSNTLQDITRLAQTQTLWVYDYRTNVHHTLKQNPLRYEDLADFLQSFHAENRHDRKESERFRPFKYDELLQRDKVSLDLIWLRDESLEDTANLPPPDVIAAEIVEDLEAALAEFAQITQSLGGGREAPN